MSFVRIVRRNKEKAARKEARRQFRLKEKLGLLRDISIKGGIGKPTKKVDAQAAEQKKAGWFRGLMNNAAQNWAVVRDILRRSPAR